MDILIDSGERWRQRAFVQTKPWSSCAIAAFALISSAVVGELLLFGAPVFFPEAIDSRSYSRLVVWAVLVLPVQAACALVLGCLGSAIGRRDLRVRGTPLAVISVIAAYFSLLVWYAAVGPEFLSRVRFLQGLGALALIGVAWAVADPSRAAKWAAAALLIIVVSWPIFPSLVVGREAARRQQAKDNLKWHGMKLRFGDASNSPNSESLR